MKKNRRLLSSTIKVAREAIKANRAKSTLIANLSYELRTALTSIFSTAQLLTMDCLLSTQQQHVTNILNVSDSILSLINRLLNLSDQETQPIGLRIRPLDLKILLEKVVKQLLFQAKSKGLQFLLDYPSTVPVSVIGDADLIHQVAIHLSSYALKNTEQGVIMIRVNWKKNSEGKEWDEFILSFEDGGKGMQEEELIKLKASLEQTNLYRHEYSEVDLGMAITARYIKLLNAQLIVESAAGKGSLFECRIPLKQSTSSFNTIVIPKRVCLWPRVEELRILLIEDNDVIRHVYSAMLEKIEGCSVDSVSNAQAALQYYMQNDYQLIFMDIGLPDSNGMVVTQIIREQETEEEHIPIIAITAHGDAKDSKKFFAAGIDEVLIKPIKLEQMIKVLEKWTRSTLISTI